MKQSSVKIKIVNIVTVLTLITFTFFTGSAVAEVNVETSEPTQNTEMNKDTNYNGPTGESRQLPDGQAEYTEEYYYEQLDGSFLLVKTETKVGTIGATVTIDTNLNTEFWDGFAVGAIYSFREWNRLDNTLGLDIKTGTVAADGSLLLKIYVYRRSLGYHFFDYLGWKGQETRISQTYGDTFTPPVPAYREGCQFSHWKRLEIRIRSIDNVKQSTAEVKGCESLITWADGSTFNIENSLEDVEVDGLWHDGIWHSYYFPVYVTAPPTPTPVTTPIPTPNPGRTCQDDGYAVGYTWNGTACVLPQVYVVPNTGSK